ncbi:MAG TPA: AAA family ATPase [Myxococcota bacterium]|nr:AAA family ATPase [Myxococcota bacterium]
MQKLAFYGKGGIGKSTIAAGVSMALAQKGIRVLHVGCDPKHDSTMALVGDSKITTVIDKLFSVRAGSMTSADLIMKGKQGIDCIESGGPEPGIGCGGRAVSRMFEILEQVGVLDDDHYDVAVFDVLGDVVCGGFAAPLRSAFAPKVVIVLSEEMAAAYAANNIAQGVMRYLDNGACLAGVVMNLRDNQADRKPVERFVEAIGTPILATIPRDHRMFEAELEGRSIIEHAPRSKIAKMITDLAGLLLELKPEDCTAPRPLEFDALRKLMRGNR